MSALRTRRLEPLLWVWVLVLLASALFPPALAWQVKPLEAPVALHEHGVSSHPNTADLALTVATPDGATACCHQAQTVCVSVSSCFVMAQVARLNPPLGSLLEYLDSKNTLLSAVSLVPTPPPRA